MANKKAKPKVKKAPQVDEQVLLNELQLLLSEKRTYLSISRTGLAVFTAPLAVVAVIAATGDYHSLFLNIWLTLVVVGGLVALSLTGLSMFYRAERRLKKIDKIIEKIENENKRIADIVV